MTSESDAEGVLVVRRAIAELLRAGETVRGCTEQEVSDFCTAQRLRRDELPHDFEEYLLLAGRRCGSVMVGSTYSYPGVLLMADSVWNFVPPSDASIVLHTWRWLAFLSHQCHTFLILKIDREGGSEVCSVDELEPYVHRVEPTLSFAEWLAREVRQATSG